MAKQKKGPTNKQQYTKHIITNEDRATQSSPTTGSVRRWSERLNRHDILLLLNKPLKYFFFVYQFFLLFFNEIKHCLADDETKHGNSFQGTMRSYILYETLGYTHGFL